MGNIFSRSRSDIVNENNKRPLDVDSEVVITKKIRTERSTHVESIKPVQIKESEVGIVAHVNPDLKGFHSILKYRAEDFLVNEVDMDKKVIQLTSLAPPNTQTLNKERDILTPDAFDQKVSEVLDKEFSKQLRNFLNHPEDTEAVLTTTTDKSQRVRFYKIIENHLETKVSCNGRTGGILFVRWPSPDYEEFIDWKGLGGDYLQVNMCKVGIDTMNAVNIISAKTGSQPKNIGYAGTKDSRAITTQSLTLKGVKPNRIIGFRDELAAIGIHLGNFSFSSKGLTLGDLGGNHFTIVLRDVQGASEPELEQSLQSLKNNGFLNYFGMQRFGTSTVLTHTIGRAIMKKNFEEASDLILNPREGDSVTFHAARTLWKETHDPEATLEILPKKAFAERKLLNFYKNAPDSHAKAIKSLPKNMLSLYRHAYQSYIWNRVVSERVKRFGCEKPLVGDIVMVENSHKQKSNSDKHNNAGRRDYINRKVPKVLTANEVDQYAIEDVVYPLPGQKTVYPQNEIGELYKTFMNEDEIFTENKHGHLENLTGDYRVMLATADDMSWSFMRYNDPEVQLCNTDIDRLEGKPEPTGVSDGQYLALKVEFTLGTSQYATMALREIMRTETSSQAQSTLSHN